MFFELKVKNLKFDKNIVIAKINKRIDACIQEKRYEEALSLIELVANIFYQHNQFFYDEKLENDLKLISDKIMEKKSFNNSKKDVVFYDGFGLDTRGLALIYVRALSKFYNVTYVTYQSSLDKIPSIVSAIREGGGSVRVINQKSNIDKIKELDRIIIKVRPSSLFMYTVPSDVIIPIVMYAYKGLVESFQINLTDHAFWLGAQACDYCIEFRDYGAFISNSFRNIPKSKILCLPYYPVIDYNKSFDGYPFKIDPSKQKVVFSGGSLYKTKGGNGLYYKIVRHILTNHKNVIFWYAGFGDKTEIDKIIKDFPDRAFITEERKDLYQVLENCTLYLSTYPVCGGLMFQYAALAKKLPLTLKFGDLSNDFLINQDALGIEYNNYDDLINELDELLNNPDLLFKRSATIDKNVISPEVFERQLKKMLEEKETEFHLNYSSVKVEDLFSEYAHNFSDKKMIDIIYGTKKMIVFKLFPTIFFWGKVERIKNKIALLFN